jgi:hypothetical protein
MDLNPPSGTDSRYRSATSLVDADQLGGRHPPMRFLAPSALPSRRIHFPKPGPGPARGRLSRCRLACRPEATHLRLDTSVGPRLHPLPDSRRVGCRDGRIGDPGGIRSRMNGRRAAARWATLSRPPEKAGIVSRRASALRSGPRSRPSRPCRVAAADIPPRPVHPGAFQRRGSSIPRGECCRSAAIGSRSVAGPGGSSAGRPPAPALLVSNRSSAREASEAGDDRMRSSSEEEGRGARPGWAWFLVASFHARFAPPTPFLTTWTVYASSNPVVSFNHSRP